MPAGRAVSSHPPTAKKPESVSESRTAGFFVLGGWFAVALRRKPAAIAFRTGVRFCATGCAPNRCSRTRPEPLSYARSIICAYTHMCIFSYVHIYICAYVHIVKTPNFYYTTPPNVCQAKIFVQFIQILSHNFVQNFFAIELQSGARCDILYT